MSAIGRQKNMREIILDTETTETGRGAGRERV
jgi:hypothetical protein